MEGVWSLPNSSTMCLTIKDLLATSKFPIQLSGLASNSANAVEIGNHIRSLTTKLSNKHPYCPTTWLKRSEMLMKLSYPDLAAGDAFKASLLLDELRKPEVSNLAVLVNQELDYSYRQTLKEAKGKNLLRLAEYKPALIDYLEALRERLTLVLVQTLLLCGCFVECLEVVDHRTRDVITVKAQKALQEVKKAAEEALQKEDIALADDNNFRSLGHSEAEEQRRSGTIIQSAYPWMIPRFVTRSAATIQSAKAIFVQLSGDKCDLRPSSLCDFLHNDDTVSSDTGFLGVFANKNLSEDQTVLTDRTAFAGISTQKKTHCSSCRGHFDVLPINSICCSAKFCTQACHNRSISLLHTPKCYHDKIQQELVSKESILSAGKLASLDLLYRILAYSKNNVKFHPLETPILGRLVAPYHADIDTQISYEHDICAPTRMLIQLGVNIFRNHHFDTWVLRIIQARLASNTRAFEDRYGCFHEIANLSYSFLNHSCEPNAYVTFDEKCGSSSLEVKAGQDVNEGEELFISYLSDDACNLGYTERQDLLKHWTGGECQCQCCIEERDAMAAPQATQSVPATDGNAEIKDESDNEEEEEEYGGGQDYNATHSANRNANMDVKRGASIKRESYIEDDFVVADHRSIKRRKTDQNLSDDEDQDFELSEDIHKLSDSDYEDGNEEELPVPDEVSSE